MNRAFAFSLILALSPTGWANSLTIPLEFEYLAVNGEKITSSLFSHKDKVDLKPGVNKIAIQYKDLIREAIGDNHKRVSSNPFVITLDAAPDEDYRLLPASKIRDIKEAERFAQAPKLKILTSNKQEVPFQFALTQGDDPNMLEQLMGAPAPAQSLEQQAIAASAATSVGAVVATAPTSTDLEATTAAPTSAGDNAIQAEAMLKYWWQQADEPTRKAFMSWAVQQL
ncbi:DUF2057 domain-containing protein [Ferrimonas pelagia]|uniref:DUF2057 domain-containing protein n=1 Tax=Ferrimonas pelagia TaxID=1177826 RepID=A0ABP9FA63_9GAMM